MSITYNKNTDLALIFGHKLLVKNILDLQNY